MKIFLKSLAVILLSTMTYAQNLPNISTQTKGQLPTNRLSAQGVAGLCLETDGFGNVTLQTCSGGGGGSGTVTSFSAGTLAPIFSTSVTNATTTPSLAFTLTSASAHSFLGNNTGTLGAPGYVSITAGDLPGLGAITIGTTSPLGGGGSVALGSSLTLTCSSCVTSIPQLPITKTGVTSNWIRSYDSTTGLFVASQPAYTDISGTPQLAITKTAVTSNWIRSYDSTTGLFTASQPAYGDISGTPQLAITKTSVASNWINSYSSITGLFTATQPATSDLSDFPAQATHSGQFLTTNGTVLSWGSPSGAGSVTSFSSGNLSPLFTTSVATATSTPAQTFSLSTAAAHTFFGNNTASTTAPAYEAIGNGDLPGSGAVTLNTTAPISGGGSVSLGGSLTFACSACLTSVTAHNILSATHGDTTTHTVLRGDLIAGIGVTPTWTAVAKGGTNTYPKWNSSGDVLASTLAASGIGTCAANQFETADNADAVPTCTQPAFTNLSGSVAAGQMPALTGDVTTTAGTVATTLATVATAGTGTKVTINTKGLSTAVANASLASADFANQGTTTTLLHGNAAGNPSFAGVSLANDTSANQGTTTTVLHGNAAGQPSFASVISGDLNITTSTCTNQYVSAISSGGVGTCTTDVLASAQHANQGTTTTVLHGNGAGNPSFTAVTSADTTGTFPASAHNLLSATHGDTTASTVTRGGLITGQVGPVWAQLAKGAASQCLQMDGTATDIIWGTCASGGSGITTLNTLTASTQTFATGTSGTDFNVSSATSTHTFNIPDASGTARGLVTTGAQTIAGAKTYTGEQLLAAATTSAPSVNTPSGTAPTTPAAGDYWRDANGFNMVESTTTNGSVDVRSDQAGSVGPANTIRYTGDSNVAKVSTNGGALEFNVLAASALTANQVVLGNGNGETKALGSLGTTTTLLHGNAAGVPSYTAVNRADEASDARGWAFCGTATGATTTVGPVSASTCCSGGTCRQFQIFYYIEGYNGSTPIGRLLMGPGTPSTTAATNGNALLEGTTTITTNSVSVPGIPLAVTTTSISREGIIFIDGASGKFKRINILGQEGNQTVSVAPTMFRAAGNFSDLSTNLPLQQFQLTVYDTITATTVSAQTFTTGTYLSVWGRNTD